MIFFKYFLKFNGYYLAHIVCDVFEYNFITMCLYCYLSKQINESNCKVQVLYVVMGDYIEEETNKFKQIETIF